MTKPNYQAKAKAIASKVDKKIGRIDRGNYLLANEGIVPSSDLEWDYIDLVFQYGYDLIKEGRRINQASYKRSERLSNRIRLYLEKGECIWLTLTFREDVLNSTSIETRRKYVQRFLKTQSDYYLANIDFGKNTQREHYHAVVVSSHIEAKKWDYGFTWTERIHVCKDSDLKLAKYVSKLTNHAIKETTKRQCYIYSRRK